MKDGADRGNPTRAPQGRLEQPEEVFVGGSSVYTPMCVCVIERQKNIPFNG